MAIPPEVTGTFSGTGNSSTIVIPGKGVLDLTFAGTATVNLQRESPVGSWVTVASYTASDGDTIDGNGRNYRLNCSAHTDNVTYRLARVASALQS